MEQSVDACSVWMCWECRLRGAVGRGVALSGPGGASSITLRAPLFPPA